MFAGNFFIQHVQSPSQKLYKIYLYENVWRFLDPFLHIVDRFFPLGNNGYENYLGIYMQLG